MVRFKGHCSSRAEWRGTSWLVPRLGDRVSWMLRVLSEELCRPEFALVLSLSQARGTLKAFKGLASYFRLFQGQGFIFIQTGSQSLCTSCLPFPPFFTPEEAAAMAFGVKQNTKTQIQILDLLLISSMTMGKLFGLSQPGTFFSQMGIGIVAISLDCGEDKRRS